MKEKMSSPKPHPTIKRNDKKAVRFRHLASPWATTILCLDGWIFFFWVVRRGEREVVFLKRSRRVISEHIRISSEEPEARLDPVACVITVS